jgi:type IV pilus assembly protein PilB
MANNTAPTNAPAPDLVARTKEFLQKREEPSPIVSLSGGTPPVVRVPVAAPTLPQPATKVSVKGMTNITDALYTKGLIDEQALRNIKFEAITSNRSPEQIIVAKNIVTEQVIQETKSEMYGIGFVDLSNITVDVQVLNKVPKEIASRNMAIAFEENANRIKVAMVDPLDLQKVKFLEGVLNKKVDAYFSTATEIQRIVDTKYGAQIGKEVSQALEDVGVLDLGSNTGQATDVTAADIDSAPVAKIVNLILDYAIKHGASDVHIEPREGKISVRYRVHGILAEKLTIPPRLGPSVVSRIKILCNMKIDEHRVPQDNRFQVKSGEKTVDIRVSVMPNLYGEKIVMRIQDKVNNVIDLEKTGLRGPGFKLYRNALEKTQGIILITGPTGSGKTLTLASSLAILNKQEVNIVTVEDPVEIRIDGVTQVQVNPEVGLTFSTALRSFLRQDPDVIMVGEIRDSETAELAIQAALVGRLVLATLHTNSAAGALPRLLDMGAQPFLLASTINVIMAQRLVRKLCDDCKQPYEASQEVIELIHRTLDGLKGFDLFTSPKAEKIHFDSDTKKVMLYKAVGCPKCGETGYAGRTGIFEAMTVSEKIGQMVMSHLSANEIQRQAVAEGMITMVQDGYMKALEGLTTIEEVLRVQNV